MGENQRKTRHKVSLIGAGQIGGTLALMIAQRELGDVVLVDITDGIPQGKALDLLESAPLGDFDVHLKGSDGYEATKDSDLYIVTAGLPRKPGMSRDDLLRTNTEIVKKVAENISQYSPHSTIIVITNPLDVMTQLMMRMTGFSKKRVVGMAGVLDTSRFRSFVAMEMGVSVEDVTALVMGGHGDSMVPLPRYCNVSGIPLTAFLSQEKIDEIVERTRNAGTEIVGLLKSGSAYYSPAAAAVEMAEAILKDKKRLLPCSAYLEGEYGIQGYYLGVPVILGAGGVERVIEVELNDAEKRALKKSLEHVKSLVDQLHLN